LRAATVKALVVGKVGAAHAAPALTSLASPARPLRVSVPFTSGSLTHIARATLPIVTDSPSGESGMADLVLFDLIKFE
jgi:hypothetical protein